MRATCMYGAGDVRVENVPGPVLQDPTGSQDEHMTGLDCCYRSTG
ncbi:MAG: Alcohol dehydrogenase GroES-associated [Pseudarthrobacter sp.]|nr:Alcohol dehydrogenase GroES-associated [Pseudarthrobacter sp.]